MPSLNSAGFCLDYGIHFNRKFAAISEGSTEENRINGLFQAAKRKAKGYGTLSTIRTVVFLLAGKLDFSKINPHVA